MTSSASMTVRSETRARAEGATLGTNTTGRAESGRPAGRDRATMAFLIRSSSADVKGVCDHLTSQPTLMTAPLRQQPGLADAAPAPDGGETGFAPRRQSVEASTLVLSIQELHADIIPWNIMFECIILSVRGEEGFSVQEIR